MKSKILIFVSLVLIIAPVAAQKRPPKPKAPPRVFATVRAAVEMGKPGAWQETVSEQGGFRVEYPGIPATSVKSGDGASLPSPINSGSYFLQTPSVYYYLHFTEHGYDGEEPEKLRAIYDEKNKSYLKDTLLKLTAESDVFLDKRLGRERIITDGVGTSVTKSRLFLIKGMFYELSATATKRALVKEQPNVDRFLSSFRLSDAPPKKPALPDLAKLRTEFASAEYEFKVAFPGKPREVPPEKNAKRKTAFFSTRAAGAEFSIAISDYVYDVSDADVLNSAYENLRSFFSEQPTQKVEVFREVQAGKYSGREFLIREFNRELLIRGRVFIIGRRMYQVYVATDLNDFSPVVKEFYDKAAADFFASFQPTGSTPAAGELAATPLPENFYGETDENNLYRNDFFGFSLQLPLDWTILNEDEVGLARESGRTIFGSSDARRNTAIARAAKRVLPLVSASRLPMGLPDNSVILVMTEKSVNPTNTPRDLALANEKSLTENPNVPMKIIRPTFQKKIGGQDFAGFEVEIEIHGERVRQQLYFTKRAGYDLTFSLGYSTNEELAVLEKALQSLKFDSRKQ